MTGKRVILTAQVGRDVRQITVWHMQSGGATLARRWVAAIEAALRHIGANPNAGTTRYARELRLDRLCFWPIRGFPYLLLYIDQKDRIDVGRVLHAKRDIPAWMGNAE